jgi:hypothetical protein
MKRLAFPGQLITVLDIYSVLDSVPEREFLLSALAMANTVTKAQTFNTIGDL